MTQGDLRKLFELSISPCLEAAQWVSEQEDQSVEGLLGACKRPEWRGFVARNTRSMVILEQLAGDEDWWVQRVAVSNFPLRNGKRELAYR